MHYDEVLLCIWTCIVRYSMLTLSWLLFVSRYWWAKIRGLAAIGDYAELERFSKQKKSPIGYEVSKQHFYPFECFKLVP